MRILIADDEPAWQLELEELLLPHFPDAQIVKVGTIAAMEAAVSGGDPFDLVLKDCRLRGNIHEDTGVPWLREHGVSCPIVVVSGSDENIEAGIADGANVGCPKRDVHAQLETTLRGLGLIRR